MPTHLVDNTPNTWEQTITVHAPCQWLNTNQRLHRMVKAPLVRQWREAAAAAAHGVPPFAPPVRIVATIYKTRAGRYDPNNLADTTKACVDGFVDAGLLDDDSHLEVIGPDHRHGGKGEPRVVFTVTAG